MIIGKKVILDITDESNLEKMRSWRNNPEFRQYYREYRVLSRKDQIRWWKEKVLEDDSWQYFVVKPIDDSEKIIGFAGLTYIHPIYRTGEFAITIAESDYQRNGYGSDALRTLIRYGFEELNLNRIWCEVYSNNSALDVYRHIGFKDEGVLRQTVYKNGKYLDSHILSMLKSDYDELEKS